MIFAATVEHAREVTGLLPVGSAALITGETPGPERDRIIEAFKAQAISLSGERRGADHWLRRPARRPDRHPPPHRVGESLPTDRWPRSAPGAGENRLSDPRLRRQSAHDLYAPEVGTPKGKSDNVPVQVFCPACGFANTFWGKTTADGTLIEHLAAAARGGSKMTTATANSATSAFALKTARSVMRKTTSPPAAAGSATLYWLTRTIC